MSRIVVYAKFNGDKEDELVINGIVNEAFKRKCEKKRKYVSMLENKNSKLLREKMDALRAMVCPKCNESFGDKARDMRTFVFACIICFLMWSGLLDYNG